MIPATAFTFPSATKTKAMIHVINDAFIGSLSDFRPLANHWFTDLDGKDLSIDNACSVRGATITEPIADEMVEAAKPKGIAILPPKAIFAMIN